MAFLCLDAMVVEPAGCVLHLMRVASPVIPARRQNSHQQGYDYCTNTPEARFHIFPSEH